MLINRMIYHSKQFLFCLESSGMGGTTWCCVTQVVAQPLEDAYRMKLADGILSIPVYPTTISFQIRGCTRRETTEICLHMNISCKVEMQRDQG